MLRTRAFPVCLAALLSGCAVPALPGGGGGSGETKLNPVTFSPSSGFPQGPGPAQFAIGGGTIATNGGTAGTLGAPGLYADDSYSWMIVGGNNAELTFGDLQVLAVDGYWVHRDDRTIGATMTASFSGGGNVAVHSAAVNPAGSRGQSAGYFDTIRAPDGETIVSLTFTFDEGAGIGDVAALDMLTLTVAGT